jgi:N-carbamoyl-L-amino-acid hydrolase
LESNNTRLSINGERLLRRIKELGQIGRDSKGKLTRLAASDNDKAGRDVAAAWMEEAGLKIAVDRIGNIFGIWSGPDNESQAPVMVGSHIDTVINAGIYDGCYGVISGIEVIKALKDKGYVPSRPIAVAAFTNEEGVRYSPDMMGSLVYAGGLSVEEALASIGTDGTVLGEELRRIGYAGTEEPGFIQPHTYIELHIEQGPILDSINIPIGAVQDLQGISWQKVTINGLANHAGTTPISMRKDAGLAAARVITFLRDMANKSNGTTVATVGCIEFKPNAVNVIPSSAVFTVDLRNPNEERLKSEEEAFSDYLKELETIEGVKIFTERLVRFEPVIFDGHIVELVEDAADRRGLQFKRMSSGAGQDAQMIARICPSAMIFVPSVNGISHNPEEFTSEPDLIAGANVLLDVVTKLAE